MYLQAEQLGYREGFLIEMRPLSDHKRSLKTIEKQDNFVKEYVTDLGMAHRILEALYWKTAYDRMTYLFYYYPGIIKLAHWKIARLTGLSRETVSRHITSIRREMAAALLIVIICISQSHALDRTLSWTAPTTDSNGDPLTNLSGYYLYYGTAPGVYSNYIVIDDPETLSYQITGLPEQDHYFAITAFSDKNTPSTACVDGQNNIIRTSNCSNVVEPAGTFIQAEYFSGGGDGNNNFQWATSQPGWITSYGYLKSLNAAELPVPAELNIFTINPVDTFLSSGSYEVGVKWTTDIDGYVTGLRYFKDSRNTLTHTGKLWQGSTLLANATFIAGNAAGWHNVYFNNPVAVTSGTTYTATIDRQNNQYYYANNAYFGAVNNAPLHISATVNQNGVYRAGAGSSFLCSPTPCTPALSPDQNWDRNQWVDVIFKERLLGDPACPATGNDIEYQMDFPETGTYNVWVRGRCGDTDSDAIYIGFDGVCIGVIQQTACDAWDWSNTPLSGINTITVNSTGNHIINIWAAKSNHLIDGIYLTTGSETPTDNAHGRTRYAHTVDPCIASGLTCAEYIHTFHVQSEMSEGISMLECTSFDYSAWSACQNAVNTRTITASYAQGCYGGTAESLIKTCPSDTVDPNLTMYIYREKQHPVIPRGMPIKLKGAFTHPSEPVTLSVKYDTSNTGYTGTAFPNCQSINKGMDIACDLDTSIPVGKYFLYPESISTAGPNRLYLADPVTISPCTKSGNHACTGTMKVRGGN